MDIDPTELRGIGIQINKLENRIIKETGRIENFISNMKSDPKANHISLCENIDYNKIISTNAEEFNSRSMINTTNTEINSKPKTVMDYFTKSKEDSFIQSSKNQPTTSKSTSDVPYQSLVNLSMSQIDPAFLDALPADVRQEIINELKANSHNSIPKNHENSSMEITMTEESSKLYQQVHVNQMKEFVEEWVATENEPKVCDNIMVSEYLCHLVKDTKTEDAYEIIRKLYR